MPKAKRKRVVNPAQMKLKPKGMAGKEKLALDMQTCLGKYKSVYVIRPTNMRTQKLKELSFQFKETSKFCFGKNRVMQKGLTQAGKTNVEEIHQFMIGQSGLLFTNEPKDKIIRFFKSYQNEDYPRAGFTADQNIIIPAGFSLPTFESTYETRFRELGVQSKLVDGKIEVLAEHVVCKKGEALTVDQAKLCKILDKKISVFKITLECHYNILADTFEKLVDYSPYETIKENTSKKIDHTHKKIKGLDANFDVLAEMAKFDVDIGNEDDEEVGDMENDVDVEEISEDSEEEEEVVIPKGKAKSAGKSAKGGKGGKVAVSLPRGKAASAKGKGKK